MSRELGGIRENGQVRECAPNLGTRPGRENMSGAVRKLLERQAAPDVVLLQRGRRTVAVTVASTHEAILALTGSGPERPKRHRAPPRGGGGLRLRWRRGESNPRKIPFGGRERERRRVNVQTWPRSGRRRDRRRRPSGDRSLAVARPVSGPNREARR